MKKILLFLLLLPALLFAQNQGGVIIVGGVAVHQPDTSAYKVINTIQAEGTALSGNNRFYVTYLVALSKRDSLWQKSKAFYGFIGGTSASHKWNWKDMRDSDDAFRITWNGTVTHNSNGAKGDGSTGYGNTHLNSNLIFTESDLSIGAYSNLETAISSTEVLIGSTDVSNNSINLSINRLTTNITLSSLGGSGNSNFIDNSSIGFYISNRIGTNIKIYKNSIEKSSNIVSGILSNIPNILFARNTVNSGVINFTNKRMCFSFFSTSLNIKQINNMSSTVTFAQGIIGRK